MQLAFVLFHYFPYGGLERDMLAMADLCRKRGHDVVIYTGDWQGDKPADLRVEVLPTRKAFTNAGRNQAFIDAVTPVLQAEKRVVIGFNKMPGLDVYYAADTCFAAKALGERGPLYRLLPRTKQYLAHEAAVFGADSKTHCLMISRPEMAIYQRHYNTPLKRLHILPPGIRRDRVAPEDYAQQRQVLRQKYGLKQGQKLLLMVGSDFKRKGLDRALQGLAALPPSISARTSLWVAGQDKAAPYEKLATELGVDKQLRILGARDDISHLMWAADAFLHPAYSENTGTVILEAMVAGLPVVCTSVCGYASYVETRAMGEVLQAPVTGQKVAAAIDSVLSVPREHWLEQARNLAKEDIFDLHEYAADLIEQAGNRK